MENVQIHDGPDLRLDFMGSFIQKTLKLKPEKWQRLLTFEEHKTVIKDFLDLPCHMVLVIQFTQSAQLLPVTTFPLTQLKSKGECQLFSYHDRMQINARFRRLFHETLSNRSATRRLRFLADQRWLSDALHRSTVMSCRRDFRPPFVQHRQPQRMAWSVSEPTSNNFTSSWHGSLFQGRARCS